MPRVINRIQQVLHTGIYPMSMYSRIVSLGVAVFQGWGPTFVVSPPLGNNVWLLGVQVWAPAKAVDMSQVTSFSIHSGAGHPQGVNDVREWENILPITDENDQHVNWLLYDGMGYMSWPMAKFFEGTGRRFAVVGQRVGEAADVIYVSFHISEG